MLKSFLKNLTIGAVAAVVITGAYAQSNPGTQVTSFLSALVSGVQTKLTALSVGSQKALTTAIVDASGNQVTTFGYTAPAGPLAPGGSPTPTASWLAGAVYRSAGVTLTDGQFAPLQFDSSGNLKTSGTFSGSISAGCTASASDPSYSAGAQSLSCDLTGYLRSLVKGTVTANAGTNLNTSLLALESGGNLATVAANTGTVAGAVTASKMQANVAQINGVTPLMGNGVTGTGSQRVTIASDNTAFSVNAALQAGSALVGKVGIDQTTPGTTNGVSIAQIGSTTVDSNSGNKSAGTIRVVLATDQPTMTNAQPRSNVASATGGASTTGNIAANNTTAVVVKASAGTLYGVQVYGIGSAPAYLKIYNATSATCGSGTPVKRLMIPAASTAANGAGSNITFGAAGVNFGTGITYCVTTGITDADTTAPAASTFLVNLDWN